MALVHTTAAAGEVATLAAGSFTGHVLVNHSNCLLQGAGIDSTTIVLDGTYTTAIRAVAERGSFTLRNLTIDCAGLSSVSAPIEPVVGGLSTVVMENVEIRGYTRAAIAIYNRAVFRGTNIRLVGDGGAIYHYTGATETTIDGCEVTGGVYAFQNLERQGVTLTDLEGRFDYWASPTYEAVTATAYAATYADVDSHVEGDRTLYDVLRYLSPVTTFTAGGTLTSTLIQQFDRVEVADGTWTQVLGFTGTNTAVLDEWRMAGSWRPASTPSGTATVYRVSLGRLIGATATRLSMQTGGGEPTNPRWRSVTGATMATPTTGGGSRLDIIRVGGSNRDVDTGGIHITEHAIGARLTRCSIRGGWSDLITLRGEGTVATDCTADLGQDMCFTVDGTRGVVKVIRGMAKRAGRTGYACSGGPVKLLSCQAYQNGTINDGSGDYGVTTTGACSGSILQVTGNGNLDGLLGGALTEATPPDAATDTYPTFVLHENQGRERRRRR